MAPHPRLRCEPRGPTAVKGKGVMETHEVVVGGAGRDPVGPPAAAPKARRRTDSLSADDLSPETRRWADASVADASPALRRDFDLFHERGRRLRLSFALTVHWLVTAAQYAACLHPAHPPRFPLGAPARDGLQRLEGLLGVHLALSSAYCAALLAAVLRDPGRAAGCRRHYVAVKALHLGFSLAGAACYPAASCWLVTVAALHAVDCGWVAAVGHGGQ